MKRICLSAILTILVVGLQVPGSVRVQAATITVNNNQDNLTAGNGLCTLREAILNANDDTDYTSGDCATGLGADVITFASQMIISLDTSQGPLPITAQVRIDASGVWDTANNRPGVSVNGIDQSTTCIGIGEPASNVEIYSLFVYNCSTAIDVRGGHNTIGSTLAGQRNVLSNNGDYGVLLAGPDAKYNVVQGNWIGLSITGDTKGPNRIGVGIIAGANHNDIGGQTVAAGNYVSGNTTYGVYIQGADAQSNRLGGNVIGLPATGSLSVGNGLHGVLIDQAQYISVGAVPMAGNTISENEEDGVHITGGTGTKIFYNAISHNQGHGVIVDGGQGNRIELNSIHHNGGQGIHLLNGANGGIGAPSITSASTSGASGTACASCEVRIFSDSEDEGETYHGAAVADVSGNWTYNGPLTGPNVTATNTDVPNTNTSEFSLPYVLGSGGSGTCANPLTISCGQQVSDDTSGYASNHDMYDCSGWPETGPEVIYQFTLAAGATYTVTAALSDLGAVDLDIFLLSPTGCSAGQCLGAGSFGNLDITVVNMPAGTYYLAVDGYNGVAGSYKLDLTCTPSGGVSQKVFLPLVLRNH
jgi:hypothetical protein